MRNAPRRVINLALNAKVPVMARDAALNILLPVAQSDELDTLFGAC